MKHVVAASDRCPARTSIAIARPEAIAVAVGIRIQAEVPAIRGRAPGASLAISGGIVSKLAARNATGTPLNRSGVHITRATASATLINDRTTKKRVVSPTRPMPLSATTTSHPAISRGTHAVRSTSAGTAGSHFGMYTHSTIGYPAAATTAS